MDLTLPDHKNRPPVRSKALGYRLVVLDGVCKMAQPPHRIIARGPGEGAAAVPMPKTTVNEQRQARRSEHDIPGSRQ